MCLHLLGSGFGVYKDCNVEIGMGTKNSDIEKKVKM